MPHLVQAVCETPAVHFSSRSCGAARRQALRSTRPSLLDLRFTGDPWVADHRDGTAALCLDDYQLVQINALSLDVPSFYHSLTLLRERQSRRCRW